MKLFYLFILFGLFSCKKFKTEDDNIKIRVYSKGNGVTDIDGNTYNTVIIGEQEWMAENLKVTKLNDGAPIEMYNDSIEQDYKYTWTKNDSSYDSIFGKLYDQGVARQNVCPASWHVPTHNDWLKLVEYVCPANLIGGKIKSVGILKNNTGLWDSETNNSSNETGFNALPSGRDSSTIYKKSYFWTSTIITEGKYYTPSIFNMELNEDNNKLLIRKSLPYSSTNIFYSIRCIKN
jgi:uncharacterized protein (TIGR02145 family)